MVGAMSYGSLVPPNFTSVSRSCWKQTDLTGVVENSEGAGSGHNGRARR